jgi:Family of unknown function (DUF6188)
VLDVALSKLVGTTVSAITLDSNVVVLFGDERGQRLRIEAPLEINYLHDQKSIDVHFDPYGSQGSELSGLDALGDLIGKTVTRCDIGSDGDLCIEVNGEILLHVGINETYESWNFDSDDGFVISLAGGQIARFGPPSTG